MKVTNSIAIFIITKKIALLKKIAFFYIKILLSVGMGNCAREICVCINMRLGRKKTIPNTDEDEQNETTEIEYMCDDCNFVAYDDLSLELHNERKHTGFFEYVFCEYTADD